VSVTGTILIAVDGSTDSVAAATTAIDLVQPHTTVLLLAVVAVPPSVLDLLDRDGVRDALDATAERMVAPARAALARAGITPEVLTRRIGIGSIAHEVVRIAEDRGCDLIVVGSHGAGAFTRAVLGSVSSNLAATAPCPVLVVPPAAHGA
jgi:nucleotide-binding universal stress UspA family protein